MRIAKALARAGLCSRREAERWIEGGRVAVNGELLKSPARDVSPSDRILVDGKAAARRGAAAAVALSQAPRPRHHPPRPAGPSDGVRRAARAHAARDLGWPPRFQHRGAAAAHQRRRAGTAPGAAGHGLAAALPGAGARARSPQEALDKLKEGVEIGGTRYGPIEAALDKVQGANVWLDARPARGQEPRGAHHPGHPRSRREPADPHLVRAVPTAGAAAWRGGAVPRRVLLDQLGGRFAATLGMADEKPAMQGKLKPRHKRGANR